ncbi:MAG: hypothetical protein ACJ77V_05310 [Chloroflexota bacterium]|jgi:hypothetical protein
MERYQRLVVLSAVPLGLVGLGALAIAVSGAVSGFGNPAPWFVVGLAVCATAIGVGRAKRWAFVGEAIISSLLVGGIALVTLFSVAMASPSGGGLDGNMFGTPFGVLNGWASLVLYAVALAASIWMLLASNLGIRSTRS